MNHSHHVGFNEPDGTGEHPAAEADRRDRFTALPSSFPDGPLLRPSFETPCMVGHNSTASLNDGELVRLRGSVRVVLIAPLSIPRRVGHQPPFDSGPFRSRGRPNSDDEQAVA